MKRTLSSSEINLAELENIEIDAAALTTDLDLTNIFYFGEIPKDRQAQGDDLRSLISTIEDWKAWETTKCEQAVQEKVALKLLPSDLSIESRAKRTDYRVKVLNYLRTRSPWIINVDTGLTDTIPVPDADPVNLAIVKALINFQPLAANLPYRNFLKAVGAGFSASGVMVQPYYHTLIGFQYDEVIEKFQAVLLTISFMIDVDEHGKRSSEASKDGPVIEFTSTPATFSVERWKETKPDPSTTESGRKMNLQKSLTIMAMEAEE